jgi:hypothetical protein
MKTTAVLGLVLALSAVTLPAADHLTLLSSGADGKFHVPSDGSLGTNWRAPAFDDSAWGDVITAVGFDRVNAPVARGGVVADSVAQFSGTQGSNNWYYGYWERGLDPDGSYQTYEFTPFPREEGNNTVGPNNFWDGSKWDVAVGGAPWTEMGPSGGHPAHHNGGGGSIQVPIRRWVSPINGLIHITGLLVEMAECGDGVIGRIYVDGEEVKSFPSAGAPAEFFANVTVQIGSTVDFAIDPGANDFCDGHNFSVKILQNTIADSVEDWSTTGQQGSRGWSYGYYNYSADGNLTYNYDTDFTTTNDGNWTFGGSWTLGPGDPPWTSIGQTDVHPNSGPEHWVIRRYTSAAAGNVLLSGTIVNTGCGGTVNARIYVDGTQMFSRLVGGSGYGFAVPVTLAVGSKVDFAIDPYGSDGCDNTRFTATISPLNSGLALMADSVAEFSGTQGQDNWYYGYYNRSGDGDATYDANADFNSTDGNWTYGGAWTLGPGDPPWTTLGSVDIHPNSGPEHWVVRRWVAETNGPVSVVWHFGKANTSGNGVTMLVMQNGVVRDSAAIYGWDKGGVTRVVTMNLQAGDKIDFAQTPVAPGGETDDGADGSVFNAFVFRSTFNPGASCTLVADSVNDWSATGDQNYHGWTYGFYDKTADGDHIFQAGDFNTNLTWNAWAGAAWAYTPGPAPWTSIGQTGLHPNGVNNANEQWPIRRWTSTVSGKVRVDWTTAKSNPNGAGVTGLVMHNGALLDSVTIAGNDTVGVNRSILIAGVNIGDVIDLALTPVGIGGDASDGADGSVNRMTIYTCAMTGDAVITDVAASMRGVNATAYLRVPFNGVADTNCLDTVRLRMGFDDGFVAYLDGVEIARRNAPAGLAGGHIANSSGDWTPNAQGANNWFHGYYNKTADGDHIYQAADFDPNLTWGAWAGAAWAYSPGPAPWTSVGQTSWHPNGDNNGNVHWVIRRWVSETSGDVTVNLRFAKGGVGGNGITGRLFKNNTQVFAQTIAFDDTTGVNTNLAVTGLVPGDTLDFALDPLGTDASENDGSDGASGYMDVRQTPSPALTWNSRATASRTTVQATNTEVIDITAFKSLLGSGGHVLAIHVLNACVDDPDLLVAPEITATIMPPKIQTHPTNILAQQGDTVIFTVAASSALPPTYQWRKGGVPIVGETAAALGLTNVQPADAGNYDVVVSNAGGSTNSSNAVLVVNRPPVALTNFASTLVNTAAEIARFKLLQNDSDPDGDPFDITTVSATSVNGGTVVLGPASVTYTPPANFTGLDFFTYTIADNRGGSATTNVAVAMVGSGSQNIVNVVHDSGAGTVTVTFAGIPGYAYRVQYATELTPPVTWTDVSTNTVPPGGLFQFVDVVGGTTNRFYRTAFP